MIGISKEKLNMRDRNAIDILNELIHNTLLSPSEIGQSTGLSQATVCRILGQLQDGNLVKNMGKVATSKGRKPNLFSFNFNYGLLLHYYVTNRKVTGYLLNLAGDIINHCEISYEQSVALEDLIKIIDDIRKELYKKRELKFAQILAAGFTVPGVVDKFTRKVYKIPDVLSLNETNFYDYAEKVLGVPIVVNNASWMAALGEKNTNYKFVENLVYLNITNNIGIGVGIIIDNKLVKGANDYAGEVGQFYFDPNCSIDDYLKGKGQLENEASIKALFARVDRRISMGDAKILSRMLKQEKTSHISLEILEEAVQQGDTDVFEELEPTMKAWAIIIINMNLLLNPDFIILGGAISDKNSYVYQYLNGIFNNLGIVSPKIRLSTLGDDAQLIGGTDVLKQYVYDNIIVPRVKNAD